MKTCRECGVEKPDVEFQPTRLKCRACVKLRQARWAAANADKRAEQAKRWATDNAETVKAYRADYYRKNKAELYAANRERALKNSAAVSAYNAEYRKANAERLREYRRGHYRQNKAAYYADNAKRRALCKQATPRWADMALIADVYRYAEIMRECGVDCHVDHAIPLISPLVCGLHTHDNLTVLLAEDNLRKSNSLCDAPTPGAPSV